MAIPRPRGHALADLIPPETASNPLLPPPPLRCCCGRDECVFLHHNQSVLDSVERDVHTAAKLGQVCCPPPVLHSSCLSFVSFDRDRTQHSSRRICRVRRTWTRYFFCFHVLMCFSATVTTESERKNSKLTFHGPLRRTSKCSP